MQRMRDGWRAESVIVLATALLLAIHLLPMELPEAEVQ